MAQDIILTVDYHDENCVIRHLDCASGEEKVLNVPTGPASLGAVVDEARRQAEPRGGRVIWIQESTTGWARSEERRVGKECRL